MQRSLSGSAFPGSIAQREDCAKPEAGGGASLTEEAGRGSPRLRHTWPRRGRAAASNDFLRTTSVPFYFTTRLCRSCNARLTRAAWQMAAHGRPPSLPPQCPPSPFTPDLMSVLLSPAHAAPPSALVRMQAMASARGARVGGSGFRSFVDDGGEVTDMCVMTLHKSDTLGPIERACAQVRGTQIR